MYSSKLEEFECKQLFTWLGFSQFPIFVTMTFDIFPFQSQVGLSQSNFLVPIRLKFKI